MLGGTPHKQCLGLLLHWRGRWSLVNPMWGLGKWQGLTYQSSGVAGVEKRDSMSGRGVDVGHPKEGNRDGMASR